LIEQQLTRSPAGHGRPWGGRFYCLREPERRKSPGRLVEWSRMITGEAQPWI
jgi:hypothetical protein